ncbi:folate-binding protein YgfZ [Limnothrix sp. FACHB-881]|uniref:CAF17-like 4Fe-4S cluster assembly/insertion protein YgfZ n=1 Tax=Limnothrix sp. FACHB-881 TaxID=2692819 RepID=UPI001685CEDB|nr:folate-binding protein YgfZ [Limnothrix sp. FACHB-881]MBD2633787.1 folate-binding protein YgfZ [Limnothrix sp. FACHB-881]
MVTLQDAQQQMGAVWDPAVAEGQVPAHFGNDPAAIAAVTTGVALVDRSHWALLQLMGDDRASFLHNQSTANIKTLQPGQGCQTVLVTSTARTLDLAMVAVTAEALDLLVSPGMGPTLFRWLDRYIFPADRVALTDISGQFATFSLLGPQSDLCLQQLGAALDEISALEPFAHQTMILAQDVTVRVQRGSGLATDGYTLWVSSDRAGDLWQAIAQAGAVPLGEQAWEQLRITEGRPAVGHELTEDYNPLEAGLWTAVSFNKGCYIGQETIARLNTYNGVKLNLWGFRLPRVIATPCPILQADQKVGTLTSCVATENGAIGLGYLRTKVGGAGLSVMIDHCPTDAINLPFITRELANTIDH